MLAARTTPRAFTAAARPAGVPTLVRKVARPSVAARALDETNFFVNLLASSSAGAVAYAATVLTAENKEAEVEKITSLDVNALGPLGAAILVDALVHALHIGPMGEPLGAATGVAYVLSLVLSSSKVDPKSLAPTGEKAKDARAAVRVPFTSVISTLHKVVDVENNAASGAGWKTGPDGLPKLPVTSVLGVIIVGSVFLELVAHGTPVLNQFMPRVLQVAGWLATAGFVVNELGLNKEQQA